MPYRRLPLVVTVALTGACKPPPPAPEGLDESARYVMREFYADDDAFAAGITGFMDWFENGGGKELIGAVPGEDKPINAFEVTTLAPDDVQYLPLADELVLKPGGADDGSDEVGPRDLTLAAGVVSVALMDCDWKEAERLLVLPEQDAVFSSDWEAYSRTYLTSRSEFEDARATGEFARIRERFDPHGDKGVDHLASTILFTDNMADPSPEPLVGNLPAFPLRLELRHGLFELEGRDDPAGVLAIITYAPEAFWGDKGKNGFVQSFSVELNVEQEDGQTLRMLAVWNQPDVLGVDPTADIAKAIAVNKSARSSDRMKAVCEGTATLDL